LMLMRPGCQACHRQPRLGTALGSGGGLSPLLSGLPPLRSLLTGVYQARRRQRLKVGDRPLRRRLPSLRPGKTPRVIHHPDPSRHPLPCFGPPDAHTVSLPLLSMQDAPLTRTARSPPPGAPVQRNWEFAAPSPVASLGDFCPVHFVAVMLGTEALLLPCAKKDRERLQMRSRLLLHGARSTHEETLRPRHAEAYSRRMAGGARCQRRREARWTRARCSTGRTRGQEHP
jgi:hypothetical protein